MIWMGRLGPEDIAAVGVAGMVVMMANAFLMGVFTGLRSMVARHYGAQDRAGAIHVAQQACAVAGALGVILAIMGILLDRWVLGLLGVSPAVVALGAGYMRINFIGMIAMALRFTTDGIMQASGDTVNPMKLAVAFRLFHVIISPVLIFGLWIFPEFGINGAAIAGVFSQSLGTLLGFAILLSGRSRLRMSFRGFRLDPGVIWRLIKIGLPASIMGLQMQFGQLVMTTFVVPFGDYAVAAHTLCQRIDMTISMPLNGLGVSAGVLVGQNLGARLPQRAEKSGWTALAISEAVLVIIGAVVITWPTVIIHIFSTDAGLDAIAVSYIKIAAVGYMVTSFNTVLQSCISGAGDTIPPLLIAVVIVWALQVPLGASLSHTSLGVFGVRWAIVAGAMLSMVAYAAYFRLGRWKRKQI